jgi:ABC-type polysaccharide/polyol phosphate transport system ATPase subunit
MNFISKSEVSDEPILKVVDLNLVYKVRHYSDRSFRDRFVRWIHDPAQVFFGAIETAHVLKNIRLDVKRGDRLAILGVNGSGKTSLCRCIAKMLHPTSGSIQVKGSSRAVFNAGVAVIPELTGRENARLLARLLYPEEKSAQIQKISDEAIEFADLGGFVDAPYEIYSQGMKARLCLSLVTAKSCDLLILDEVYDNTDTFFKVKLKARLKRFIEGSGAVIFVSHSQELIETTCNRAIVLHESEIKFDGDVESALRAYRFLNLPVGELANVEN